MNQSLECIFCKINKNELPSYELLSSPCCKAILDIRPITKGHIIVISKSHTEYLHQLNNEEYFELFKVVKQLTHQLSEALPNITDCNVVINNGRQSGQHIDHVHVHIIPRTRGDTLAFYWRLLTRFINPFGRLNKKPLLDRIHKNLSQSIKLSNT